MMRDEVQVMWVAFCNSIEIVSRLSTSECSQGGSLHHPKFLAWTPPGAHATFVTLAELLLLPSCNLRWQYRLKGDFDIWPLGLEELSQVAAAPIQHCRLLLKPNFIFNVIYQPKDLDMLDIG